MASPTFSGRDGATARTAALRAGGAQVPNAQPTSRTAQYVLAASAAGMGLFIVALAAGVVPVEPGAMKAPRWVVGCAGLVFVVGGLMVALADPNAARDPHRAGGHPVGAYFWGALFTTLLGLVFTWVAFGGGEREFTSTTTFAGTTREAPVAEGTGRTVFGVFAVLIDAAAVAMWYGFFRRLTARGDTARRPGS